jgi:hypothetical protein
VRAAVEYADDAGLFVILGLHSPTVGAFHGLQETREVPFVFVESAAAGLASALAAEAVENCLARGLVEILLQDADELGIANTRRLELPRSWSSSGVDVSAGTSSGEISATQEQTPAAQHFRNSLR